jgi:hypothetical protein
MPRLRSATSDCAQAIGLGHLTGRLAAGYSADVLFVDGDPLADLDRLGSVTHRSTPRPRTGRLPVQLGGLTGERKGISDGSSRSLRRH